MPRPKPTALKIVEGTRKSRINAAEPQPTPSDGPPVPPEWLSPDARVIWDRLALDLYAQRVLTTWDVEPFALYCEAVISFRDAIMEVRERGVLVKGQHGERVKNPAMQLARDSAQVMRSYAIEFGLTPSARSSIRLQAPVDDEEARRLLA